MEKVLTVSNNLDLLNEYLNKGWKVKSINVQKTSKEIIEGINSTTQTTLTTFLVLLTFNKN